MQIQLNLCTKCSQNNANSRLSKLGLDCKPSDIALTLFYLALGSIFYIDATSSFLKASYLGAGILFLLISIQKHTSINKHFFIYLALISAWTLSTIPAGLHNPRPEFFFFLFLDILLAIIGYTIAHRSNHHNVTIFFLHTYTAILLTLCILDAINLIEFRGAIAGGASENYTTALLIGWTLLAAALTYRSKGYISYTNTTLLLLASIYLESRFSSLTLASALVFFVACSVHERLGRHKLYFRLSFLLLASILITLAYFISPRIFFVPGVIATDPRIAIWSDFILNAPATAYISGIHFEDCCTLIHDKFFNNPHNSYIRSIAFYGAGGHVIPIVFAGSILLFIFSSKNFFYSGILLLWIVRASSDSIALPHYFDFFLFSILSLLFSSGTRENLAKPRTHKNHSTGITDTRFNREQSFG